MNKFSVIVPVYNTEKYLDKCILSILNQSYSNLELIIVNDGSTDNSLELIKKYKDKRIKVINQKNLGLSEARNNGIKKSTGDYLLFVDSDDYISDDLLKVLDENISNEEVIRFQINAITDDKEITYEEKPFYKLDGKEAFKTIADYHYVETACCYAIKRDYYIKNEYKFIPNTYHEDFGLIPLIIINANSVSSIDYVGYNYVTQNGSITSFTSYEKEVKKTIDVLNHYKNLINKSDDKYYKSFLANSVLIKAKKLKGKELNDYIKEIKNNKIIDNIIDDSLKRKIKKILLKANLELFIKVI